MIISHFDCSALPSRRKFRWRWLFGSLAISLLALFAVRLFFMWSFDEPLPPDLAAVGQLPITLPDGRPALLRDTIRPGVPTVISLWASWCGPCFSEAPRIAELRRQFSPADLNIVYVNVRDPFASSKDLARYMRRFSMPLDHVVMRDVDRLSELTNDAGNLITRTLVFDKEGRPTAAIVGYKPLALSRIAGLVED